MLKDITLGQYFPGDTPVHRLDPRTKLLLTVLYIILLFVADSALGYLLLALAVAGVTALARIRPVTLFRGLKPLVIIIAFTAVLNLFFTDGTLLWQWHFVRITHEGVRNAVLMVLRVMLLVTGTLMLTYTTAPLAITDGMERLLSPLKRLHVPVYELSLMMSIALRFIPVLIEETDRIMSAQRARGADFESGGLVRRARALLPLLIPLFVSAFRRADELATAMECRCYNGGEGRTRMKELRMARGDVLALVCGGVFTALIILCRIAF